jgi:hypothetical protein
MLHVLFDTGSQKYERMQMAAYLSRGHFVVKIWNVF